MLSVSLYPSAKENNQWIIGVFIGGHQGRIDRLSGVPLFAVYWDSRQQTTSNRTI